MATLSPLPLTDAPGCRAPLVQETLPGDRAAELARSFKALGDPARLRLLTLIAAHPNGSACVCDLTGPLGLSQPTVSHHLKKLRDAGLVTSERKGTWVHYTLVPGALGALADVLADPRE